MKRIAIMFCMVLSMTMTANAQTNGLTEGEEISIRERCDVMINDFQHYLEIIAGKGKSLKVRNHYVAQTYKLFIGECEAYKDLNSKKGAMHEPVQMQVSSLGKKEPETKPMKEYLNRLKTLPYAKVEIKKAQTHKLSDIKKVGDRYEATATIYQEFRGYNENGQLVYGGTGGDWTEKSIRIYIEPTEDVMHGAYFDIKLGDTSVVETKAMK